MFYRTVMKLLVKTVFSLLKELHDGLHNTKLIYTAITRTNKIWLEVITVQRIRLFAVADSNADVRMHADRVLIATYSGCF